MNPHTSNRLDGYKVCKRRRVSIHDMRLSYIMRRLNKNVKFVYMGKCMYFYTVSVTCVVLDIFRSNEYVPFSDEHKKIIGSQFSRLMYNCVELFNYNLYNGYEIPQFIEYVKTLCMLCIQYDNFIISRELLYAIIDAYPICNRIDSWGVIHIYKYLMCDRQSLATLRTVFPKHFKLCSNIIKYIAGFIEAL